MNEIIISFDETHHLKNGKPLYPYRFDKVQSFHFPLGYAPVKKRQHAFFINTEGKTVFERAFKDAFGFYDNIATVVDENGFFHIDTQGHDIHSQRFAWAGNFQESLCVVKDIKSKQFFHIDKNGKPIYTKKYAYVGDYRYGIAVIMNNDGLCTHIDTHGKLRHKKYFLELDVYHKGYAIAKDERGYFHINKAGKALYNNRYLKLEPFYNGRAVAVDQYGVKLIISTEGETIQKIDNNNAEIQKIEQYYSLQAFSYWHSRILTSILELGVLDQLENGTTLEKLYQQTNLPKKSIDMILRWLTVYQVSILKQGNYSLTLAGKTILHQLKPVYSYWQNKVFVKTSLELVNSLKNHKNDFNKLHQAPFFEYIQKDTKLAKDLDKIMSFYAVDYNTHLSYLNLSNESVCDIGGGNGALLSKLKQHYPKIKPIVLDKFTYDSYRDIEFIKIDFFEKWNVKSDVYLISRILHDWNDKQVIQILKNIANNMDSKTIFYIFETIVSEENLIDKGVSVSFHLLNVLGGRERTLPEFIALFKEANLKIKDIYLEKLPVSLIKIMKKQA
ncbi:MAG: hypothetical protein DRQ57_08995 [Gammaproteobacteria bacterium]|nr:MAG: hypothetical protein DRQ57_08995 [Gammaproteobacteria bacterium]